MRKLTWIVVPLCLAALGCSGGGGGTTGISGTTGSSGGTTGSQFTIQEVDLGDAGSGTYDTLTAARSSDGRIGIAYYWDLNTSHKRLEYVELNASGQRTTAVTLAQSVENVSELSVAFDQQGNTLVAYLGNDPAVVEPHEQADPNDGGVFWEESDLALAKITPSGTLTTEYPVHLSNEAFYDPTGSGNSPENFGEVVGVSPAIQVLANGQVLIVYRDVHDGTSNDIQGFDSSDVEAVLGTPGTPGTWVHQMVMTGRDETDSNLVNAGLGAGETMATYNGVVAMASSGEIAFQGPYKHLFQATFADGGWASKGRIFPTFTSDIDSNLGQGIAPTGGPHIAADPTVGFGLIWDDMTTGVLHYASSTDGINWNSPPDSIFGGSGGWFPNLAFDPTFTPPTPAAVYYVCSNERGSTFGNCPATEQELRISERRTDGSWTNITVDPQGGAYPYLFFGDGGQFIVVYRSLVTGGIRIAQQQGAP